MRTEDHLALGCYLLSQENVPQLRQHCIAMQSWLQEGLAPDAEAAT